MGSRSRAAMSMAANVVDDMVAFARKARKVICFDWIVYENTAMYYNVHCV